MKAAECIRSKRFDNGRRTITQNDDLTMYRTGRIMLRLRLVSGRGPVTIPTRSGH